MRSSDFSNNFALRLTLTASQPPLLRINPPPTSSGRLPSETPFSTNILGDIGDALYICSSPTTEFTILVSEL